MSNPGFMVMLNSLFGTGASESKEALEFALNKVIQTISLDEDDYTSGIVIKFHNGKTVRIWDGGQSCCESRYITTDDNLAEYENAIVRDITLENGRGPDERDEEGYDEEGYDCHETQFLRIHTDKGVIVFTTHNVHNGYYGGFYIQAALK